MMVKHTTYKEVYNKIVKKYIYSEKTGFILNYVTL